MRSRTSSLAAALLVLGSMLFACAEAAKPAAAPASPPPSPPPVAEAPADAGAEVAALPPGVPDSPAGHQLAWVLGGFVHAPTAADVAQRFTPDFLAQVPAASVVELFNQIGGQFAPFAVERIDPGATPLMFDAIARTKADADAGDALKMKFSIKVEDAEPHRIAGLLLRPALDAKPAGSWDEVQSKLRAVAPQVSFLAAEVAGGKCVPLSAIEPKKPFALGSAFKLYVLDALAKQIAAGKHKWDETIAIDDAKKSLPSGDMRNEPAGKTFTVRQFAEKMISVSDNTATDHLLAFVGRPAAEDAVKSSGNATPARDVPFLSTRDMFALKLLGTQDELRTYAAADVPHKRKTLSAFEARELKMPTEELGWDKPRMIDSIEWFASAEDLCKLMVLLKSYADTAATAPVGEILSINPGLPDDERTFKYIAFKGGSEPGVLNLTWLLQRKSDDKWFFLTVGFNDPAAPIDEPKAIAAVATARAFLSK